MYQMLKFCLIFLSFGTTQTLAQTTPDHVYQVTEGTVRVLDAINKANYSTPKDAKIEAEPALPRHVLQLARAVWRKTQLLRFINGLPTTAL